jgi:hypothetical protein
VLADPQIVANQSILEFEDPSAGLVRLLGHPIRYDGEVPGLHRLPPTVGQHTEEVLRELGYVANDIERLREMSAVGPDRAVARYDRKASAPASTYSKKSSPGMNQTPAGQERP